MKLSKLVDFIHLNASNLAKEGKPEWMIQRTAAMTALVVFTDGPGCIEADLDTVKFQLSHNEALTLLEVIEKLTYLAKYGEGGDWWTVVSKGDHLYLADLRHNGCKVYIGKMIDGPSVVVLDETLF